MRRPLVFALLVLAFASSVKGDDPVSSNVRYTGEIARIFDRKCTPCHDRGSLAVPLTTYREVRDWGRAIREEIVEQRMPPWNAARGHARFRNELALTAREATTILSWLDGGMPRGDDRDLPPPTPSAAAADAPDLRLSVPPQRVAALGEHIVRRAMVATNLDRARMLRRVVVNPGRRDVLRGVLVFAGDPDAGGRWIGGWLPWQPQVEPPEGSAVPLPARAELIVELHYRGGEQEVVDSPTLDLFFSDREIDRTYESDIVVREGAPTRLAKTTTVWAILPRADAAATSLELTARRPNGAVETLLWIPTYRPEWPQALALQDPIALPAGTTLTVSVEPASASATARLVPGKNP